MKRITFLTVAAVLITLVAASCGQNAPAPTVITEEPQQTEQQPVTDSDENESAGYTYAYVKFDGTTLLVDEFVLVCEDDDDLMEKYGLTEKDLTFCEYGDCTFVNEVEKYEEWKLLPDATFNITTFIKNPSGSTSPLQDDVELDEFTKHMKKQSPPMLLKGSRSGVSRIEQICVY